MKLVQYLEEIVQFLRKYLEDAKAKTYILGLSGGLDSSVCAALAKKAVGKDRLLGVIIPINSMEEDALYARKLCRELDINYLVYDGTEVFNEFKKQALVAGLSLDKVNLGNLKARIRMAVLYAVSQEKHGLVIGTDNAAERYTGYFTKYGDGACDLLPIAHLLKSEVVAAAKMLNIPSEIIKRVPSACLFEGQTDENEMGVTYKDLDAYLLGKPVDEKVKDRIEHLHKISRHKVEAIPMAKPFEREEE
ncbi:MAG TPA: NAD(+) synthase [Erysipelotrichaceae bacterium]|nr:NAD(+) synthase [Erysipelotrichaceae bacterium]